MLQFLLTKTLLELKKSLIIINSVLTSSAAFYLSVL